MVEVFRFLLFFIYLVIDFCLKAALEITLNSSNTILLTNSLRFLLIQFSIIGFISLFITLSIELLLSAL